MKQLNLVFDNEDFEDLKNVKGDRTWRGAILEEFGIKQGEDGG